MTGGDKRQTYDCSYNKFFIVKIIFMYISMETIQTVSKQFIFLNFRNKDNF
jgi:hypothetical protein